MKNTTSFLRILGAFVCIFSVSRLWARPATSEPSQRTQQLIKKLPATQNTNQFFPDDSNPNSNSEKKTYLTKEEARMALRNELLEQSKDCNSQSEVGGYVIQTADGKYETYIPPQKATATRVEMKPPSNAVESMHTHPSGGLGVSGQDALTAIKSGIPAYALDCQTGDVYGSTEEGIAVKLICDEQLGICSSSPLQGEEERKALLHSGSFSQNILNERIDEERQKQEMLEHAGQAALAPPPQTFSTEHGVVNADALFGQTYTVDNTARKQYLSQQLEGAYSKASGIAAEAGVGAEYQSAVAPVMSQSRAAISSIPDQQQIAVPAGVPAR